MDYATNSLIAQFPFLDPNAVRAARDEFAKKFYRHIAVPLNPGYTVLLTEDQIETIKQFWYRSRYARVDLMVQLGGEAAMLGKVPNIQSKETHPHYLLVSKSIDLFISHIQIVANRPPGYYREAVIDLNNAEKLRATTGAIARKHERHLNTTVSKQLLLTEQLSFLLASLLETSW